MLGFVRGGVRGVLILSRSRGMADAWRSMTANDHADVRFLLSGSRLMFMWAVRLQLEAILAPALIRKRFLGRV